MPLSRSGAVLVLLACLAGGGCDSCDRETKKKRATRAFTVAGECGGAGECDDGNPCTEERCVDGRCRVTYLAPGTSCDDDTVCNGVAECDGNGNCVEGPAPQIDDGNTCTIDSCDPIDGVVNEPIPVDDGDPCTTDSCDPETGTISHDSIDIDDGDECTTDACDPETGEISHVPVDVDDGDDCTFDACDPKTGVQHERLKSFYTCKETCGEGFHAASRRASGACGSPEALQTFCAPDCGESFYTCDARCPERYAKRSSVSGPQCLPNRVSLFCLRK